MEWGCFSMDGPEVVCLQNVHFEFNFKERLRDVTLDESDLHYNEKISALENDCIFNKVAFLIFFLKNYNLWG